MIKKAISKLKANEAVIIPTDTIYGISMLYSDKNMTHINRLKKRRENQELIVLFTRFRQIKNIVVINKYSKKFIKSNHKTTVILKGVTKSNVSVRIIRDGIIKRIIKKTGPIYSSSANISSQPYLEDIDLFYSIVGNDNVFYIGALNSVPSKIYDYNKKSYYRN
ncbi:L-threonylcarbamoyladenylate synthase [Spiroplasma endosymbiont of Aspidapion aeneum]|uniref:L-threonylcarbamoyladenylate synthase n=1 Tax=Spiroplasma endosymbiont of Aspidapion aeneum TaxID=3066276 RepID=UPI00313F0BE9